MDHIEVRQPADLRLYTYQGDDFGLLIRFLKDDTAYSLSIFDDIAWHIYKPGSNEMMYSFLLSSGELNLAGDDSEILHSAALGSDMTDDLRTGSYDYDLEFTLGGYIMTYVASTLAVSNVQQRNYGQRKSTVNINSDTGVSLPGEGLDEVALALAAQQGANQALNSILDTRDQILDTKQQAITAINNAKSLAISAVDSDKSDALQDISDAADAGLDVINSSKTSSLDAISQAQSDAVSAINDIVDNVESIQTDITDKQDDVTSKTQQVASDKQAVQTMRDETQAE